MIELESFSLRFTASEARRALSIQIPGIYKYRCPLH